VDHGGLCRFGLLSVCCSCCEVGDIELARTKNLRSIINVLDDLLLMKLLGISFLTLPRSIVKNHHQLNDSSEDVTLRTCAVADVYRNPKTNNLPTAKSIILSNSKCHKEIAKWTRFSFL
jgi:hypothetical protein